MSGPRVTLITASGGLIGSAAVAQFDRLGTAVHGVDNATVATPPPPRKRARR